MSRPATRIAAAAAVLIGLIVSGAANAGHAGYGHGSGAKIHITFGHGGFAFGAVPHHGRRLHHGRRGHYRPHHRLHGHLHAPVRHGVRPHGVRPHGVRHGGVRHHGSYDGGHRGCRPTSKVVQVGHGRRAVIGGLMCHDRHGQPYIASGSRHVIYSD